MISIIVQCIDFYKHSCAMEWDCIALEEQSCSMHLDCNAYDKYKLFNAIELKD